MPRRLRDARARKRKHAVQRARQFEVDRDRKARGSTFDQLQVVNHGYARVCREKVRYRSWSEAKSAQREIRGRQGFEFLRTYHCKHCGGFHHTSQPRSAGDDT